MISRIKLLTAVDFASKVIGKASLPILENVHLKGDGERVMVTGDSLDLYARMDIEGALDIDVGVPAKRLKAVLSAWPDEEIGIVVTEGKVTITGANGRRAPIETLPGDQFPPIPEVKGPLFVIPSAAISRVIMAVSTDTSRYTLNAVWLEKGHAVATDGSRMHAAACEGPEKGIIIPSDAAKILAASEGEMRCDGRRFMATGDGWEIGGKVIEGNYPNWRQVLPKYTQGIETPEGLIEVIERAQKAGKSPTVTISPDQVRTGEVGDEDSEDFETGMPNVKLCIQYFLEALKAAGEGSRISVTDEVSAIVVHSPGFEGAVMPMRVN